MTIVFEDSLQGGGILNGRVSTSGHVWVDAVPNINLDSSGASVTGAGAVGLGKVNEISIPAGQLTFESRILGSSIATSPAAWVAWFGAANASTSVVFAIALRHLAGTIDVREYNTQADSTLLFSFARVAATVYDLRVEFDGVNYTVFLDDVQMYGPAAPVNSPVGLIPTLRVTQSGSGTTNKVYMQYTKITLAAPPAAFWTNRIKTAEIV